MSLTIALLFFLVLVLAWIYLPFIPGTIELRRKEDAWPLRVVHRSEVDIRHFARGFRAFVDNNVGDLLIQCREGGGEIEGELSDGTQYLVLAGGDHCDATTLARATEDAGCIVAACDDLDLPGEKDYPLEIYSQGSLQVGDNTKIRAALAEKSLHIGSGCTSVRWLHAGETVAVGAGSQLYGRVSANRSIVLGPECSFERLNAPQIVFEQPVEITPPSVEPQKFDPRKLPHLLEEAAGRCLYGKATEIPAGSIVETDIIVRGKLKIGDGAQIKASLKSHGKMEIGKGVQIEGAVVSENDIHFGEGCQVTDPIISEEKIYLASGCVVGSESKPTTVSARGIAAASGTVVYGTIWGRG